MKKIILLSLVVSVFILFLHTSAYAFQLSSSHENATAGDIVKFSLTLPSHLPSEKISNIYLRVKGNSKKEDEYKMDMVSDFVYEFDYKIEKDTSGELKVRAAIFVKVEPGTMGGYMVSKEIKLEVLK